MKQPSKSEIERLAQELSIGSTEHEIEILHKTVSEAVNNFSKVQENNTYDNGRHNYNYTGRESGYQPGVKEDPNNAWITKCHIEGNDEGKIAQKTVGLKDNIAVAGIELTNGSRILKGYVPTADATIVSRLLDNGAVIKGKNNLWNFSIGNSDFGRSENPTAPNYTVGGSSSGTATAVANEEVDIGIGGDQGGSIRLPSSFSGIIGLKPTFGLVPYTGILGSDMSVDHTGPMTRTVEEAALTLEVIAGRDGLDPRQPNDLIVEKYSQNLDEDISDMTIGILSEGFYHDDGNDEVSDTVYNAISELEELGVETKEISIPEHLDASSICSVITTYGGGQQIIQNNVAIGQVGWQDTNTIRNLGRSVKAQGSDLPLPIKNKMLVAEYVRRNYQGTVYAQAQNMALELRRKYSETLSDVDAIILPTCPIVPPEKEKMTGTGRIFGQNSIGTMIANTSPFNLTHHPALTIPCGTVNESPIGMMIVGSHFDENSILQIAHTYEQNIRALSERSETA